jgi:hypothetical protein
LRFRSGLRLGLADPIRDIEALEAARRDAFSILDADFALAEEPHCVIAAVLERAAPFGTAT